MRSNKRDVKKMIKDAAFNIKYLLHNVVVYNANFSMAKKKYKNNRIILKKDIYEIVILVRIVIIVFLKHFSLHIYFLSFYRIENRIFTFIINFIFYYKINH